VYPNPPPPPPPPPTANHLKKTQKSKIWRDLRPIDWNLEGRGKTKTLSKRKGKPKKEAGRRYRT
jgi:hypothetical protein